MAMKCWRHRRNTPNAESLHDPRGVASCWSSQHMCHQEVWLGIKKPPGRLVAFLRHIGYSLHVPLATLTSVSQSVLPNQATLTSVSQSVSRFYSTRLLWLAANQRRSRGRNDRGKTSAYRTAVSHRHDHRSWCPAPPESRPKALSIAGPSQPKGRGRGRASASRGSPIHSALSWLLSMLAILIWRGIVTFWSLQVHRQRLEQNWATARSW